MSSLELFGVSIALSFIAWSAVTASYFWPELRSRPRAEALRPLLLLHAFRFVGLAFLVPGVVSPELPAAWARPAAYGDLVAALLALLALPGSGADWGSRSSGYSTSGAPPTFFTPSIGAMPSGSTQATWVLSYFILTVLVR